MKPVVYDAGPLIAAERNDRRFWAEHRARLELGIVPCVPSPILAQVSRSPKQVQLRRLLRGCEVVPLDETGAHQTGALLGKSRTTDIADATLVSVAATRTADILTSDSTDIEPLVAKARVGVRVIYTT
jgi:hypothetical protein